MDLPNEKRDTGNFTWIVFRPIFFCYGKASLPVLQKHGLTPIICKRQNIEANFVKSTFQQLFSYLVLDIADNLVENRICHFPIIKEFIGGEKVTVHGNAGISRSAASVITYSMETSGMKRHICLCSRKILY